jgi:hypothetical protein
MPDMSLIAVTVSSLKLAHDMANPPVTIRLRPVMITRYFSMVEDAVLYLRRFSNDRPTAATITIIQNAAKTTIPAMNWG